jgi:hypothetical protein
MVRYINVCLVGEMGERTGYIFRKGKRGHPRSFYIEVLVHEERDDLQRIIDTLSTKEFLTIYVNVEEEEPSGYVKGILLRVVPGEVQEPN